MQTTGRGVNKYRRMQLLIQRHIRSTNLPTVGPNVSPETTGVEVNLGDLNYAVIQLVGELDAQERRLAAYHHTLSRLDMDKTSTFISRAEASLSDTAYLVDEVGRLNQRVADQDDEIAALRRSSGVRYLVTAGIVLITGIMGVGAAAVWSIVLQTLQTH